MEGEIKAELHCHTIYSKGESIIIEGLNKPRDMIRYAKKHGIECIAITDHDTMKGIKEARKEAKKQNIIFIPGMEISSSDGHIIALGIQEEIKPKLSIEETLDEIKKQSGIAIAVHPFDFRRKGLGELGKKCDAIEIFNALNIDRFANKRAEIFFRNKPFIAGSDAHWIKMLGYGTTIFKDCFDEEDCLRAIMKKKVKIKKKYIPVKIITDWSVIRIKYSYYHIINYMNKNYSYPKKFIGNRLIRLVEKSPGKIDYFFRCLAFLGLGFAISYSFFRNRVFGLKRI